MKFCYLIMTHHNAVQIARLVRTVLASSRDGWVLLLHDRKGVSLQDVPELDDPRVVVLTAPFDIHRGEFSQVEAYLHGLGWLQRCARPWHWPSQPMVPPQSSHFCPKLPGARAAHWPLQAMVPPHSSHFCPKLPGVAGPHWPSQAMVPQSEHFTP